MWGVRCWCPGARRSVPGAVFPTQTKPARVIGRENLSRWVGILGQRFALTAIGGIKIDNIESVLATGVGSVAVATAVTEAADYPAMDAAINKATGGPEPFASIS